MLSRAVKVVRHLLLLALSPVPSLTKRNVFAYLYYYRTVLYGRVYTTHYLLISRNHSIGVFMWVCGGSMYGKHTNVLKQPAPTLPSLFILYIYTSFFVHCWTATTTGLLTTPPSPSMPYPPRPTLPVAYWWRFGTASTGYHTSLTTPPPWTVEPVLFDALDLKFWTHLCRDTRGERRVCGVWCITTGGRTVDGWSFLPQTRIAMLHPTYSTHLPRDIK